ncbi:MAG: DoxX family protein [Chitinophagaceae bacterium]
MSFIQSPNLILRLTMAVILLMHSVPGMFNGGVYEFGEYYLNEAGFSPAGLPVAWLIKLSHVLAAICFLMNRFVSWAAWATIVVLIAGILMVHLPNGWYVVGAGRNGIEFNILMIAVCIHFIYPNGLRWRANVHAVL